MLRKELEGGLERSGRGRKSGAVRCDPDLDFPWVSASRALERSDPHKDRQEAPVLLSVLQWPDFLSFVSTCFFWLVSLKCILGAQEFHQDTL